LNYAGVAGRRTAITGTEVSLVAESWAWFSRRGRYRHFGSSLGVGVPAKIYILPWVFGTPGAGFTRYAGVGGPAPRSWSREHHGIRKKQKSEFIRPDTKVHLTVLTRTGVVIVAA